MTFINLSGIAVKKLLKTENIKPEEVLVIYDDMDLPLGRIKLLPKGGAGGHNGVKSIISELGVNTFPRLRLGIGRPPEGVDPKDYVLSPFTPDEASIVEKVIEIATQALEDLLQQDLLKVMTKYNSLKI
jgi:PTH1 family peptidyl-tRNA hydrolase